MSFTSDHLPLLPVQGDNESIVPVSSDSSSESRGTASTRADPLFHTWRRWRKIRIFVWQIRWLHRLRTVTYWRQLLTSIDLLEDRLLRGHLESPRRLVDLQLATTVYHLRRRYLELVQGRSHLDWD